MKGVYHAGKVNALQIRFGDVFVYKSHGDVPGKGGFGIVPRAGSPGPPANWEIKTALSAVIDRH
jgi:hypothetical protein